MGDEICVGRKEIVAFFQELKLIPATNTPEKGWLKILKLQQQRGLDKLIHRLPNNKPKIIKTEVRLWLEKFDEKSLRNRGVEP